MDAPPPPFHPHLPHPFYIATVLAYLIAALSPNMDVANAALPTYVVVSGWGMGRGGELSHSCHTAGCHTLLWDPPAQPQREDRRSVVAEEAPCKKK